MRAFSLLIAVVLLAIAGLHLYWAIKGPGAASAVVPEANGHAVFRPGPIACVAVALLLVIAALLVLARGGAISLPLPQALITVGAWGVGLVFALRAVGDFRYFGYFRKVTDTAFARNDAWIYTPLVALLAFGVLCVACFGQNTQR